MKLKHEPDAPVAKPGKLLFRQSEDILGFIAHGASRRSIQGSQNMEQGAFPRSRRPKHGQKLALPDFEIDAFQDVDGLIAQDERLGQIGHLQKRRCWIGRRVHGHYSYRRALTGASLAACHEGYSVAAKLIRMAENATRNTSRAFTWTGMLDRKYTV